jgi:hypothetical protein
VCTLILDGDLELSAANGGLLDQGRLQVTA